MVTWFADSTNSPVTGHRGIEISIGLPLCSPVSVPPWLVTVESVESVKTAPFQVPGLDAFSHRIEHLPRQLL